MTATPAIDAVGLVKTFGQLRAVDGVDLDVRQGEIFGVLGPNGAGKTTIVEILTGFRSRTAGDVRVLGVDPQTAGTAWRERVGVVLQESQPDPGLTVHECLSLYAGYYRAPRTPGEIAELVGLADCLQMGTEQLSGGQRRRLDIGLALIGGPELLFLDEPTTGFDPAARRAAWDMIRALRSLGKTILLTTHYLDEAEQLADRVAVLREGQIIREGTPAELTGATNETEVRYRQDGHEVVIHTTEPTRLLQELTAAALAEGREVEGLQVRRPTLEDVYLSLTAPEER